MSTALVTGCNKGIGFYIAQGLCAKGYTVIMGCRDPAKSVEASNKIKGEYPQATLHHVAIDVAEPSTIAAAAADVKERFQSGIDVIVNNAGIAYGSDSAVPFHIQADVSLKTNYGGTRAMCETFAPLMKKGGRIINVSSTLGSLNSITSDELKKRWIEAKSADDVETLVNEFLTHTRAGDFASLGWPESAYGVSKLAVTTLTRIFAASHPDLHVFACCPGWCRTEMTGQQGLKSATEGADTPLWLATSAECLDSIPPGGFAADRKAI